MPTSFEHSARFAAPASTVYKAFTSEEYWQQRVVAVGGPNPRVEEFSVTADGVVQVAIVQAVAEQFLPTIVTKFRPGDLEINRTEEWQPPGPDGSAKGAFSASIPGVPAGIGGTLSLTPDATGSRLTIHGEVEIRAPLIGGKIERAAIEQLRQLLVSEDDFTAKWTASR